MLPLTPFIGRDKEFAEIQPLLEQPACRLLTLVGPGGTGKTRLALQLGAMNEERFAQGTAVVTLQPLRSAEFFIPAIADAVGFSLTGQEPPVAQLSRYLSEKEIFIILDNFEHILDAADQLIDLLPASPHVKYLVTSREALNLQDEWLYPLTGLTFPTDADDQVATLTYDAVQLFAERARRAYPSFSPADEAEAIARICQLVDGLPLALELAAVWRRNLSCEEIATEIQRPGFSEYATARCAATASQHSSYL